MNISKQGLEFLAKEEGCRLKAYKCSAGINTIGYGSTFYEDGSKVKEGDIITKERALKLFDNIVQVFVKGVLKLLKVSLNQNQLDAIVSLVFNIGLAAFGRSTVLKLINQNPNDPKIGDAIEMWRNAGGKPILLKRRKREVQLYFKK